MARHRLRIGEVARRSGVPVELLRAWERRYGVPTPERSAGGFRLYSEDEIARVTEMRALVADGVAPAEAARAVLTGAGSGERSEGVAELAGELLATVRRFGEGEAQRILDRALATLTVEAALETVILPLLRRLGDGWQAGEVTVAQEHFASQLVRGRLLGLARGWSRGQGKLALLACPPGEQHDVGLIAFGIALNRLGWRIAYLGADTPLDTLQSAAEAVQPDVIALGVTWRENQLDPDALARVARDHRVVLGGPAAEAPAAAAEVEALPDGAVGAAERLR